MIYSTAKSSPNDAAIVDANPAKPSKGAVPLDTVIPITGVPVAPPTPPQQTQGLPLGDDDEWMSPEMKLGEMQEDLLWYCMIDILASFFGLWVGYPLSSTL